MGLVLNLDKCYFRQTELPYIGEVVKPDPDKSPSSDRDDYADECNIAATRAGHGDVSGQIHSKSVSKNCTTSFAAWERNRVAVECRAGIRMVRHQSGTNETSSTAIL